MSYHSTEHSVKTDLFKIYTVSVKIVKLRYKNSIFGVLWTMLNPLIYLSIFIFIFSHAFPDIENYPLFALIGLIFWNFFNVGSNEALNSIVASAGILKSVRIRPIIFPISAILAGIINLVISLIPFTALMLFFGFEFSWTTLLIIPFIILLSLFTFGIGAFLCALNVYFRDVGILWNAIIPAIFYFTPVAYSFTLVPARFQKILMLNPLYHFFSFIRAALYDNTLPTLTTTIIVCSCSIVSFIIGLFVFSRLRKGFISHY